VTTWLPMADAPRDGTLIDLNFDGIRQTDCHFWPATKEWRRVHGYPSSTRVFFHEPDGWTPRPEGLVLPYNTNSRGDRYIP
jgi:hypothetical protein